ncbi:MAG: hypothetical protein GTO45_38175 [Candidatus Aminicenantes bacterium]|nr:hypothetical protein [Candidatus Aminicenantes bacterium]NIM84452.1 hypothetical protein [Candidatus Aminicenantes bacterium]NIN23973.1 hypothetical protein [Candidatus Aminicenantes bacterium]NIN47687.1 hypothetical protein [Candidatus Aminicenantes bacterium]NIN90617.1 hypothetical protein [Candidatus Aminicenantes bacterium]
MKRATVFLSFVLIGSLVVSSISVPKQEAIPASENAALIALYNAANGDNWYGNSGWKPPPLHTDGFAMPKTEGNGYIKDKFTALIANAEELENHRITAAVWVPESVFGNITIPAHASLVGYFAGEPDEPHAATYFTLRIPEGWESNNRLWVEQPAGQGNHLSIGSWLVALSRGRAIMIANTFDLNLFALACNSAKTYPKRMAQAVRVYKSFIENNFAAVNRVYGVGFSRGATVMNLVAHLEGTPFDAILSESGAGGGQLNILTYLAYGLKNGVTKAPHPSLELPTTSPAWILWAYQTMYAYLLISDPSYQGAYANWVLEERPQDVQQLLTRKNLWADGNLKTKIIFLSGLLDPLAPCGETASLVTKCNSKSQQDNYRLYCSRNYGHGFSISPDLANAMEILENWVENQTEPGLLVTYQDSGGLQHSKAAGYENDPVGYMVAVKAGTIN